MEQEGVIDLSSNPWFSLVVLVRGKDGSTRFCVDYRKLNDVTKKKIVTHKLVLNNRLTEWILAEGDGR